MQNEFYVTDVNHPALFSARTGKIVLLQTECKVSCVAFYLRTTLC